MTRVNYVVQACAAAVFAVVASWQSAAAEGCSPSNLASFSKLGKAIAEARNREPGKLLAAWLLRPRSDGKCEFVFRVDLLMENGQVQSMNFDARTLKQIEIANERDWVEAGGSGEGAAEPGGDSTAGASQGSDDRNDDNSGRGSGNRGGGDSSSSGSGGGDDSSGSGGSGGSDSSGSGGGDDSSGSGSGGDDSSGSGSGDD